ncbi:MAG: sensor histidine kinase [Flavobacteriaceae bacterium]
MLKYFKSFSLRARIFVSMVLLLLMACLLILLATLLQYDNQSSDYNSFRLYRKENQIKSHLNTLVNRYDLLRKSDSVWRLHTQEFRDITSIHKVEYSFFNLEGAPIFTTYLPLKVIANNYRLPEELTTRVRKSAEERYLEKNETEIGNFQASYSLLKTPEGTPYGILFYPYFEDVSFSENELSSFLQRLYQIYILMLLVAILLAYFISRFATRSLERIRLKMDQTALLGRNERIELKGGSKEILSLVNAYNKMIDDLDESAQLLAKTEREQAWQEMAKQVAHEIKNPLTPMRLTVQSFEKTFDQSAADARERLKEFSQILVEQIDTMSNVANAFSDFATLPKPQLKKVDLVELTRMALQIYEQDQINFFTNKKEVWVALDRTQWIRVVTNLIKNALQAMPPERQPKIQVRIEAQVRSVVVSIADNGVGVPDEVKEKIFDPKFTTKTRGMGLGLGIVKNIIELHQGNIRYTTQANRGTTFIITMPLNP